MGPHMPKKAKHPVRTTEKSLEIVSELNRTGETRVTTLANELEMGKSTVHNHLTTLEDHGYVVRWL